MNPLAARLPDFPWDRLAPYGARARAHVDGIVDLSIGTPVDDVPVSVQSALALTTNTPGYPLTHGTPEFRQAVVDWAQRSLNTSFSDTNAVIPTIGSKEMVALLPLLLGLGPQDTVVVPSIAYPTYVVGAQIAGCTVLVSDNPQDWGPEVSLVWLNSPSNPTGAVSSADTLRAAIIKARAIGAVVASDECYIELGWTAEPVSVLSRDVVSNDFTSVLALHSLSKRSNLAGYRAASVMGDPAIVKSLLEGRKHIGLLTPAPVVAAATAALNDDVHVQRQKDRYRARRELLQPALESAGFTITHSQAGLYLWASRNEDCWATVGWLADRGILVAPGQFYGEAGKNHVRVALTATDERISSAVQRLSP